MKLPIKKPAVNYWVVIIIVALLTGAVAAAYDAFNAASDTRASLLDRSKSIAELISSEDIQKLNGDESDTRTDTYNDIKSRLVRIRESYQDVKYIYIVNVSSNTRPYYMVDSSTPGTTTYAEPGQPYPEGAERIKEIFNSKEGRIINIENQRQGNIMSAFSPIVQYSNGTVSAVLGMDISYQAYYRKLAEEAAVSAAERRAADSPLRRNKRSISHHNNQPANAPATNHQTKHAIEPMTHSCGNSHTPSRPDLGPKQASQRAATLRLEHHR